VLNRFRQGVFAVLMLAGVCLSGTAALAAGGYYKWLDERGNPQLSDRPPPAGVEYEYVSTDTGLKRRVSAAESGRTGSAPAMPEQAAPASTVAQEQAKIKKNPAYCDQAKANLDTLNSAARVRIREPEGDIRYLTEEEKDVQRQKAKDMIAVHCN
jgi:hypothetical protein